MIPPEWLGDPACQRLTWTLLHFLWQGFLVTLAVAALLLLLRPRRAQTRYVLCLLALAVTVACPPLTFVALRAPSSPPPLPTLPLEPMAVPLVTNPPPQYLPSHADAAAVSLARPSAREPVAVSRQWQLADYAVAVQPYFLLGWVGGVLLLSLRLLCGAAGTQWLRLGRQPIGGELASRVARLGGWFALRGVPRVFVSQKVREAVVVGLLRPMVLLPVSWLTEMTPEVLQAVIAHELAHIRRWDLWVNLLQRLIETLLFYHPAVWWLSRQIRLQREMCCDELAVGATGGRVKYATLLEQVGRRRLAATQPELGAALGGHKMALLKRVRYILGSPPSPTRSRGWLVGLLALLALVAIWRTCAAPIPIQREARAEPPSEAVTGDTLADDEASQAIDKDASADASVDITAEETAEPAEQPAGSSVRKAAPILVRFTGSTIASNGRLRSIVTSATAPRFGDDGRIDRQQIERDVDRLVEYYRDRGFFQARIGYERHSDATDSGPLLTFVIDEGPRYRVRDLSFVGNEHFSDSMLLAGVKLRAGRYFDPAKMAMDASTIRNRYSAAGYIFAKVDADPRLLDELGSLDLVYRINEAGRYHVGELVKPPLVNRVTIVGAVSNPGLYELHSNTLRHALSAAGGLTEDAGPQVEIRRLSADGPMVIHEDASVLGKRVDGLRLRDGDIVYVGDGEKVPLVGRPAKSARPSTSGASVSRGDPLGPKGKTDPGRPVPISSTIAETDGLAGPASPDQGKPASGTVRPREILVIKVAGTAVDQPIDGEFVVESDGRVALGPSYGRVKVGGLTLEAAEEALREQLGRILQNPAVQITRPWRGPSAIAAQTATVEPCDWITIQVAGTLTELPIDGPHFVEPSGKVALGAVYGRVLVKGLTFEEAEEAITKHLREILRDPVVQVTTDSARPRYRSPTPTERHCIRIRDALFVQVFGVLPEAPIDGHYLVESSGQIALGPQYGRVRVQGLTFEEAEQAIEKHLKKVLKDPEVFVTLAQWAPRPRRARGQADADPALVEVLTDRIDLLQRQLTSLREDFRRRLPGDRPASVQSEVLRLEAEVTVLKTCVQELAAEVEQRKKAAEQLGKSSVDVEMLRRDVKQAERLLEETREKLDKLLVETRADPDINKDADYQRRLGELGNACSERAIALHQKRELLKRLVDRLQTPEQRLAMKEYYLARSEHTRAKTELRNAEGRLEVQKAILKALDDRAPSEPRVEEPPPDGKKSPDD